MHFSPHTHTKCSWFFLFNLRSVRQWTILHINKYKNRPLTMYTYNDRFGATRNYSHFSCNNNTSSNAQPQWEMDREREKQRDDFIFITIYTKITHYEVKFLYSFWECGLILHVYLCCQLIVQTLYCISVLFSTVLLVLLFPNVLYAARR